MKAKQIPIYFFCLFMFAAQVCAAFSFHDALNLAYQNNPELQAQIQEGVKARGQFIQNGLWLNPSFFLEVENIGGSGNNQAFETAETTLWVTQPLPLGGKRSWLQKASLARYEQMRSAILRKKAELYMAIGEAYINAYYATQWHAVTKKLVRLNKRIVKDIQRRKNAGASAELDLRLAQVRLGEARIQRSRAYRNTQKQYASLARILGQGEFNKDLQDKGLPHHDISQQTLAKELNNSVFIKEKKAALKAMRLAITASKKNVWPTIRPQIGVRHFSLNNDNALVAGIASVVPVYDRNQGTILAAEADYTQAKQDLRATRMRLKQQLTAAFLDLRQNSEESNLVKNELLPASQLASKVAIQGYQKGLYTYIELSNAMRNLYEEERHYQQAHAKRDIAMIKITGLLCQGAT